MPHRKPQPQKRDDSEPEIVRTLEQAGYLVLKSNHPDLIVGTWGMGWVLMECKTPGPNAKRLESRQVKLRDDAARYCLPFYVVKSGEEAIAMMLQHERGLRSRSVDLTVRAVLAETGLLPGPVASDLDDGGSAD